MISFMVSLWLWFWFSLYPLILSYFILFVIM
nr:MAG TPA: hypothetical protein [Caudoviricetes sp.]